MRDAGRHGASQRTILYYPTIAIPNPVWVKHALFYWDEIASIVPGGDLKILAERTGVTTTRAYEMDLLLSEGVFRPIRPEQLLASGPEEQSVAETLMEEFAAAVTSARFRKRRRERSRTFMPLHLDKISHSAIALLENEGLAEPSSGSDWLPVDEDAALLYMSLLAKHLAESDGPRTVTGTDRREYLRTAYGPPPGSTGVRCLSIQLFDALPVPRPEASLADILRFRSRRHGDLRRFRETMDDLQEDLSRSESPTQVEVAVTRFQDKAERAIDDLARQLREARLPTTLGSLTTLMGSSLLPPIVVSAAAAIGAPQLPPSLTLPLGASYGALRLGHFLLDQRNEQRDRLRGSPYSYLYHARSRSLVR